MANRRVKLLFFPALFLTLATHLVAQATRKPVDSRTKDSAPGHDQSKQDHLHLTQVGVVDVPSLRTHLFSTNYKCDSDGNIYFLHSHLDPAIQKFSPKGEPLALFDPASQTDKKLLHSGSFDVALDGTVYVLADPYERAHYVFTFKPDGSFKTSIKQNVDSWWFPNRIAVFPSGEMLITGLRYDTDVNAAMLPFTGLFAADGSLLKEVKLKDDKMLHDMAAAGDKRVSLDTNPQANLAVSSTQVEAAPDGNVYLMRWTNPAIVYAISPGGALVRRFKINPGDSRFFPHAIHAFQNRLAILFVDHDTFEKVMKIVDLEGHEITTYDELRPNDKSKSKLSAAFYCYSENPTRFVFLGGKDDGQLQLVTVEPR